MKPGSFIIWLSGAQPDILRKSPADYPRYFGMGIVVLITAGIATLSMTFALHTALKVAVGVAVGFALLWGLAVMNIDRWLVVSLQRQEGKLAYISIVTIRLALGLLFGLVISTPFVLQIFAPEIGKQITIIQRNSANTYFAQLKTNPLTQRIAADQSKVNGLENTIRTRGGAGPNPYQDPAVVRLIGLKNQANRHARSDFAKWQCQLYGIPKGQCKPGQGPLARATHQRYLSDVAQAQQDNQRTVQLVKSLQNKNAGGAKSSLSEAQKSLPPALAQLQQDKQEQAKLTDSFKNQNASNAGLLLRLKALSQATAGNTQLNTARWLLLALFTVIEWLPVIVKTLLNLGPKTKYEELAELDQRKRWRLSEEESKRELAAGMIGMEGIIPDAGSLAEDRETYLPAIRQQILAAEQRIAEEIVREWERRERQAIGRESVLQRASSAMFQRDPFRPRRDPSRHWWGLFRRRSDYNATSR